LEALHDGKDDFSKVALSKHIGSGKAASGAATSICAFRQWSYALSAIARLLAVPSRLVDFRFLYRRVYRHARFPSAACARWPLCTPRLRRPTY